LLYVMVQTLVCRTWTISLGLPMIETLKVLITVKTYPIPSAKYDELVCTAGVTETGDFIRLYPINFRDLPFTQHYKKYQWIEIDAERHTGRDSRKESYRPISGTLKLLGAELKPKNGDWSERSKYVLQKTARSMEDLGECKDRDRTSLGIIRPLRINDLKISKDDNDWNPRFYEELKQQRLWDDRTNTKEPPRKVPWKFHYWFECDDSRCKSHKMMIEDWEVGALYWRMIDQGKTPDKAAADVRTKFLNQICSSKNDTHFFVGTVLAHGTWVVIGTYYPKKSEPNLFDSL